MQIRTSRRSPRSWRVGRTGKDIDGQPELASGQLVSLLATTMNQIIQYEAMIVAILVVNTVFAGEKSSVKIVNSTNIRELKLPVPDEDKTGAVAYVYAIESSDLGSTEGATTMDLQQTPSNQNEEEPSTEKKFSNRNNCVTRVIEKMKGDERIVTYNATAEEAKSAGKKIIDTICQGDEGYYMISKVNLANLEDDIYHLP